MEEEKFEIIALVTNEETGEVEQTMHNRLLPYIPTQFEYKSYNDNVKICHCGRGTRIFDSWCPSCGQRLGIPEQFYE